MSGMSQGCGAWGGREPHARSNSECSERWPVQDESLSVGIRWS